MTWRWVSKSSLLLLHGESLAEHGGATGLRNEGLLDSALGRPLNLLAYASQDEAPDFAALAASYTVGLAKNHPFVDGNKRAAFLATGLFLYLNGYRLNASQADATSPCSPWPPVKSPKTSLPTGCARMRPHATRRSANDFIPAAVAA